MIAVVLVLYVGTPYFDLVKFNGANISKIISCTPGAVKTSFRQLMDLNLVECNNKVYKLTTKGINYIKNYLQAIDNLNLKDNL